MANRTPNLWANSNNRPAKLWNLTWDQYLSLDGALWKAIAIAFTFIVVMSLLNWGGHQGWNLPITMIGYAFIWWFGLRPTHMAYSMAGGGIFAALFDRDKSQGVGGGPRILFKVVQRVSYTFLLIGFTLFTWNFSGNLGAFWVTLIGVVILTQTGVVDGWRTKIITVYVVVCILAALWSTFGTYSGRSFDTSTGAPLYMVDPVTGRIDSEGRTPADCEAGNCFSAETGERLRPMTREEALGRNPAGIGDSAITAVSTGAASVADHVGGLDLSFGCPEKTIIVQPTGSSFDLKSGCRVTLDLAVLQQDQVLKTGNRRALFGANVVRLGTNEQRLMDLSESEVFSLDTIRWVRGRPMVDVVAQDFGGTVHLTAFDKNLK